MNRRFWALVFSLVLLSALLYTDNSYLVTVDLRKMDQPKQLQDLDMDIYFHSREVLIAGVPGLNSLIRHSVPFTVIDDNAWSDTYYLLTGFRESPIDYKPVQSRVIYQDESVVLLKSPPLTIDEIIAIPCKITEFFPIPINYRFERVYPSPIRDVPLTRIDIDNLLSEINPDSLGYFVQSLEDFGTRYCFASNRDEVASWIENEFLRFGYTDVVIDSFFQSGIYHKNVVATLPGTLNPEEVVIVGGHHDSFTISTPLVFAPGADDNATGAGAALEIARAMKAVSFQPEASIKFITFAAEEVGLWGSHHYAQAALDAEMDIKLMINNDMIGHTLQEPENWTIQLIDYNGFENEAHFCRQVLLQHTNIMPVTNPYFGPGSDSYAFWLRGFPPVFFIETDFNPYYHTPNDLFIHLNMDYTVETVRGSAAIAALINYMIGLPEDLVIIDAGNGNELIMEWSPDFSAEIDYYRIHVGLSTGNYFAELTTDETNFTITGLEDGVTYYIGLAAVGSSGYSSSIYETTGVPRIIPLTPQSLSDYPHANRIDLTWSHNLEADLAGYNIYRSESEGVLGEPINPEVVTDNYYSDFNVEAGVLYYYSLTAIDETNNESDPTEQIYSRIVSLDQGILIAAGTTGGNGGFQNPTIESITQFYNQILSGYSPDIFPLWQTNRLKLADIGAYSTVVWHKNNTSVYPYSSQTVTAIQQYLDAGGNILFSMYFPGRMLGHTDGYPQNYYEGSYVNDYLKIDYIDLHQSSRFIRAQSIYDNYPPLNIDQSKTPAGLNHHIINIESIQSNLSGTDIYSYHSDYPTGSPEASMHGLPVGTEYIGEDYKVILLSFPLYYIEPEDASSFINYVMTEKFNEPLFAEEDETFPVSPSLYTLQANYPNPFNPETTIVFSIEKESDIKLTVYNLKGQRVKTLVNERREPGKYPVLWNGRDENEREVASGIYLYHLTTDFGQTTAKMLLIK